MIKLSILFTLLLFNNLINLKLLYGVITPYRTPDLSIKKNQLLTILAQVSFNDTVLLKTIFPSFAAFESTQK